MARQSQLDEQAGMRLRAYDVHLQRPLSLKPKGGLLLPTCLPACSVIPGLAAVRNMYIIIGQGARHAQSDARHQIAGDATYQPGTGSQSVDAGGFSRPG